MIHLALLLWGVGSGDKRVMEKGYKLDMHKGPWFVRCSVHCRLGKSTSPCTGTFHGPEWQESSPDACRTSEEHRLSSDTSFSAMSLMVTARDDAQVFRFRLLLSFPPTPPTPILQPSLSTQPLSSSPPVLVAKLEPPSHCIIVLLSFLVSPQPSGQSPGPHWPSSPNYLTSTASLSKQNYAILCHPKLSFLILQ